MNKIWICVFAMMFGWGFESQAQRDNTSVRIVSERDKTFSHTIERGQTVYAIATMYGVSTEDIYRLNPDSRNGIKAGDTLLIPQQKAATEKAESASATQNYTFHTIQKKETLYAVSMRYKVPATEIVKANPGLTAKTFTIGRTIRIPNFIDAEENAVSEPSVKTETVVTEEEYKIARRETMYSLCILQIGSSEFSVAGMGTHLVKPFPLYLGSKSLAETSHGSSRVQGAEREGIKETKWLGFSEREWLWAGI